MDAGYDWTAFITGFATALMLVFALRWRQARRMRPPAASPPSPLALSPRLSAQVRLMKAEGREIEAIKLVRKHTGCDLVSAKYAVEQLR